MSLSGHIALLLFIVKSLSNYLYSPNPHSLSFFSHFTQTRPLFPHSTESVLIKATTDIHLWQIHFSIFNCNLWFSAAFIMINHSSLLASRIPYFAGFSWKPLVSHFQSLGWWSSLFQKLQNVECFRIYFFLSFFPFKHYPSLPRGYVILIHGYHWNASDYHILSFPLLWVSDFYVWSSTEIPTIGFYLGP